MFLLSVPSLQAQGQAPARDSRSADVANAGTSSIAGVIVDQDRKPVRRASVSIGGNSQPARTIVTDEAGRFLFAAIPAGRYTLTVRKPGYPQMSFGAREPFRTGSGVVVAAGQALSGLSITLARGGVIEGTVYNEQGQPVPGVPVQPWELRTALGVGCSAAVLIEAGHEGQDDSSFASAE
jgi:protocatechuate 3,4-dioxygenase beta subunit